MQNIVNVELDVMIQILVDETTNISTLLDDINGQMGTLDVAGYRFEALVRFDGDI